MSRLTALMLLLAAASGSGSLWAQEPLAVGTRAPDFALVGATKDGVLPDSVRLSDFAGHTVILAFFYRARTPG